METMGNTRLIEALNRMLAKEHGCAIRYATYAALVSGPFVDPLSSRFQEMASDEIVHAGLLRKRICGLGGTPTMEVDGGRLQTDGTLEEMVKTGVLEEREAIKEYGTTLETIPRMQVLLYRTLEDILRDECEHLEELLRLDPSKEETASSLHLFGPLEDRRGRDTHKPGQMAPLESRD
jgi:bacterioferritin (cytochrome b1)